MKTYYLADQVTSATATYGPLIMTDNGGIYVQISGDGTAAGTLTVQTSADGVNYVNDATTIALSSGAPIAKQYTLFCQYIKFSYVNSGTGLFSLVVNVIG